MTTAPDIFLSYNREDQPRAKVFAHAFAAQGFDVWWDATLKSGEAYDEVTESALRTAKAVVVLWSPRSVVSRWVRAEATLADRNKTLVPCTIEPCDRPIMFELTQTADLSHWQGEAEDEAWKAFLADVQRFVGKEAPAETVQTNQPAALPLPSKPSIAVMPFANLSGDPDQDYFADGMVVEVVEALSRFRSIFVIASGSSLSFKGKNATAQDAARQLGVRYILEGNVRKAGERVRIGVQLIEAADSRPIWTHRFEDTLEDVFGLQEKVALAVAGKIEPTIQQAEILRVNVRPTENMGSYDLYLRALAAFSDHSATSTLASLELAQRASTLDPDYAPALALLARVHHTIESYGWSADPEFHRREGMRVAQRALKLAKGDASILASVAPAISRLSGDWSAAHALAVRATNLNPGSSHAWMSRGFLHMLRGESDLAIEALEASLRLDPLGPNRPIQIGSIGQARFFQGRFAEAVDLLKATIHISEFPGYSMFLAAALGHLGQTTEATAALRDYQRSAAKRAEEFIRSNWGATAHAALILEGLALAEGGSPRSTAP